MTNPPNKDKHAVILRQTREHKGISLEMAHEATKIPLDALRAIEQGYSVHRLQAFYYRGFIKIYAKYLEIDETQVLQEYGIQETSAPKPQMQVKESKLPQPLATSNNFAKDTLKPFLKNNLTGERLWQLCKFLFVLLAFFLVLKMAGCVVNKVKSLGTKKHADVKKVEKKNVPISTEKISPKEKVKSRTEETPPAISKPPRESVEKKAAAALEDAPAPKTVKNEAKSDAQRDDKKVKHIDLTVRATKSGWLQVKADGQVVFQSTLKKGAAEAWSAADEIELSGKNINLLEFELNGKMLGALGPSDRGAKRVVFTKDGLSVKK